MKKIFLLTVVFGFMVFSVVQAQVICDFEVAGSGTQGFVDNGWTSGITGVERVADPTGRSEGVLAVGFDAQASGEWRGTFAKTQFGVDTSHFMSFMVWLPADFPDSGVVQLMAQDNEHWNHQTVDFYAVDLGKEKWVTISFDMYTRFLVDTANSFNPFPPNQFGFFGVQLQAGPGDDNYDDTFIGTIYFDDLTLLGANPRIISNFEIDQGTEGWNGNGWGDYNPVMERVADPTGVSTAVLAATYDFNSGARAAFEYGQINVDSVDRVFSVRVFVPSDFPDDAKIKFHVQDNIHWASIEWPRLIYSGSDIPKDRWWELYWDMAHVASTDITGSFTPYEEGAGLGRITVDVYDNTSFAGTIYFDDFIFNQPGEQATADLISPPITVTAGIDTMLDETHGRIIYHNEIKWEDISADIGETYNLYYSEDGVITDVTSPDVIQISTEIPHGTEVFYHRMFTEMGEEKTVYYAMTVTGVEGAQVVEKPVRPDTSNSGAVTANTCTLVEIPYIADFSSSFVPDAFLDEFEALETSPGFARMRIFTETAAQYHAPEWFPGSPDCDMDKFFVVYDANNIYVGAEIRDDSVSAAGLGQTWEGDGFDLFGGLYDAAVQTSLFKGTDAPGGGLGGYRFGPCPGAAAGSQLQTGGGTVWVPDDYDYVQDIYEGGWAVEIRISLTDMFAKFGGDGWVPASGMYLPLKVDINDNDGVEDKDPAAGNNRSLMCQYNSRPENFTSWQRAEAWQIPAMLTSTPLALVAIEPGNAGEITTFALEQNYPNPFNPRTTLKYQLPHVSDVSVVIYDILGREVKTLVNEKNQAAGPYTVTWNSTNNAGQMVSSGIYFYKLVTPEYTKVRKMMLLK